jgi:hypothetical protein
MNCKYCGLELPAGSNPRREFCNDAHKQAYWRAQQKQDQAQEIDELASQITTLRDRLDYERRYLEDTTPQRFKAWLRKQPSSPWRVTFLNDQTIKPLASRSYYGYCILL